MSSRVVCVRRMSIPSTRTKQNSLLDKKIIALITSKLSIPKVKEIPLQEQDLNTTDKDIPVSEDKEAASLYRIPKEYNEFIKIFIKKIGLRALLKH